jgi:hypothetical protein
MEIAINGSTTLAGIDTILRLAKASDTLWARVNAVTCANIGRKRSEKKNSPSTNRI